MAKEGEIFAEAASCFVNSYSSDINGFVAAMLTKHRTLQQAFTKLCLYWLYELVKTKDSDLRNEAAIAIARKIDEAVDLKEARHLPLI